MANDTNIVRPNMRIPVSLDEVLDGGSPSDLRPRWVRAPAWPPMLRQSTNPDVFAVFRCFSTNIAAADTDNVVNQEITRLIRFTVPVICYAVVGSVRLSDSSGFPVGYDPLSTIDVKLMSGEENVTVETTAGQNVLGTAQRPGFLGGAGWVFNVGVPASWLITPTLGGLAAGVKQVIRISMHVIEFRRGASYNAGAS